MIENVLPRYSDSRIIRIHTHHFHPSVTKSDNNGNHSLKTGALHVLCLMKFSIGNENYTEELTLCKIFSYAENIQCACDYEGNKDESAITSEVKT